MLYNSSFGYIIQQKCGVISEIVPHRFLYDAIATKFFVKNKKFSQYSEERVPS